MVNAAAITVVIQLFNHQAGQLKEEFFILKSILTNLFCITHPYCSRCKCLCIHKAWWKLVLVLLPRKWTTIHMSRHYIYTKNISTMSRRNFHSQLAAKGIQRVYSPTNVVSVIIYMETSSLLLHYFRHRLTLPILENSLLTFPAEFNRRLQ